MIDIFLLLKVAESWIIVTEMGIFTWCETVRLISEDANGGHFRKKQKMLNPTTSVCHKPCPICAAVVTPAKRGEVV